MISRLRRNVKVRVFLCLPVKRFPSLAGRGQKKKRPGPEPNHRVLERFEI